MYAIDARNVNDAFVLGLDLVRREGLVEETRAGRARVVPTPVVTVYDKPTERVLLDPTRDANPFFHLFESLHMLAGRFDYTWLDRFVGNFSKRFGEPDQFSVGHGAYGWRWRHHFQYDQLDVVVDKLRKNPGDRRVVVQMWDATYLDSGFYGADDLRADKRDVPCNTHVYPRIVGGRLELTVCCRSNDLIWGLCGANAVHFSMLQEYLAGRIGIGVGRMYTLSNNLHAYVDVLEKQEWSHSSLNPYEESKLAEPTPIGGGDGWMHWDEDLAAFMRWADDGVALPEGEMPEPPDFVNEWFANVAYPMWMSHHLFKIKRTSNPSREVTYPQRGAALDIAFEVAAPDWRRAAVEWLGRRIAK